MRSFRPLVLYFDVIVGCSVPAPFSTGNGSIQSCHLYVLIKVAFIVYQHTHILYFVYSQRPSLQSTVIQNVTFSFSIQGNRFVRSHVRVGAWYMRQSVRGRLFFVKKPATDAAMTPIPFKVCQIA
jgi:hypothetical protein